MSLARHRQFVALYVSLVMIGASASVALGQQPAPGKQVAATCAIKQKTDAGEKDGKLGYLLYLPADYETKRGEQWPLVLFLHGSGERGDDIEKVKIHGPPKLAAQGKQFPFVLVSPQCPGDQRGWNAEELNQLVEKVASDYRVDRQRLYVTGLSMGGSGTWRLVAAYPDKFAAAMPLCGRGDLDAVETLAKTPIWVLVGAQDSERTVENCQQMGNALAKAGCEGRFTLYFELKHDCWTVTYNNPETYEWLLSHRRK